MHFLSSLGYSDYHSFYKIHKSKTSHNTYIQSDFYLTSESSPLGWLCYEWEISSNQEEYDTYFPTVQIDPTNNQYQLLVAIAQ